ncbi:MAG: hypothetical protein Kow0031_15820 [Anaerolineae bacterium]
MGAIFARFQSWRRVGTVLVLLMLFSFILTSVVSANAIGNEAWMWSTVCHFQPNQLENPQTMVIYWSALDKFLTVFADFLGTCPSM